MFFKFSAANPSDSLWRQGGSEDGRFGWTWPDLTGFLLRLGLTEPDAVGLSVTIILVLETTLPEAQSR